MPLFDYVCGACDAHFEALVAAANARPACPKCSAHKSRRQPAAPASRAPSNAGARAAPTLPIDGKPAGGCGLIERPAHPHSSSK